MQFAQLLDGGVLQGREPGVVPDEGVGVRADLEGEQGEELMD